MKNQVQLGAQLIVSNKTSLPIRSGDTVLVGQRIAVATVDIDPQSQGVCVFEGVFELPKVESAGSGGEQGDEVYYIAAEKKFSTEAGGVKAGFLTRDAKDTDTSYHIKLNA